MPSEKILNYPDALCNQIRRLAIEAGEATLEYFDEAGISEFDSKSDGSPVTLADHAAEEIIRAGLKEITPSILMIGEEASAKGALPDIAGQEYFWLVDPLDGTRQFIKGEGDYTVNIALVHQGVPILGVIYAPVLGELYAGHGSGTAIRWLEENNNEKEIRVRRPPREGLTIISSKSHGDRVKLDQFLEGFKIEKVLKRGSSLKICAVASGKADLYPRFGETSEWDTAAGDAILRSAGGAIIDFKGAPLIYGQTGRQFINPEFVAFSGQFDLFETES